MTLNKPRLAVAMSGGVDSAVAAAILVREGYKVIGLFAKTWSPTPGDGTRCTWVDDRRDALRVAARLNIPLVTIDAEKNYQEAVLAPWVAGYARGETPNPDVWCNRVIKFGLLFDQARAMGAVGLATGHYARIQRIASGESRTEKAPSPIAYRYSLHRAIDGHKDQAYFLWDIPVEVLPNIQFPIGQLTKPQVRRLAKQFNLPVAAKKDSQGICLLGPTNIRTFLRHRLRSGPGPIYDWKTGRLLGQHAGLIGLTIGQRHGISRSDFGYFRFENRESTVERPGQISEPLYIIAIDMPTNSIVLGPASALVHRKMMVTNLNWLAPNWSERLQRGERLRVTAQIRYQGVVIPARLQNEGRSRTSITFDRGVVAPAVGQSIVFYARDQLLGGAIIEAIVNSRTNSKPTFSLRRENKKVVT